MALRALSSGPTTAINSGRSSISSSARTAKTLNLARPITETEVLEQTADLVLEIPLDLDQQRPARQQRLDRVTIEILDANLLEPAGLHDAGDAGRIIAVTLIDLHLKHRLGMARIDTDHRQAKSLELGPQPRGRRPCLKTDPYRARRFRPHKRSDRIRVGINYALSHDRSRPAHHTDRCLLQRHVQSNTVIHRHSPIVARPHEVGPIRFWRADSLAFVWHDFGIAACCKTPIETTHEV